MQDTDSENGILRKAPPLDVFKKINSFQIGLLKPPKQQENQSSQQSYQSEFIPMFPLIYEQLNYGKIIKDSSLKFAVEPKMEEEVR